MHIYETQVSETIVSETCVVFYRLMQEEFFQHTIPIIPRIADGRMVHRHRLHTSAVVQEISARRRAAPVHYYRLAVLPSLARHLAPKALAPNDDILGLILVERFEERLAGLPILS